MIFISENTGRHRYRQSPSEDGDRKERAMNLEEIKAAKEKRKTEKDTIGRELKDLRMQQATKEAEVTEIQRQISEKNEQTLLLEKEMSDLDTAERILKLGSDA